MLIWLTRSLTFSILAFPFPPSAASLPSPLNRCRSPGFSPTDAYASRVVKKPTAIDFGAACTVGRLVIARQINLSAHSAPAKYAASSRLFPLIQRFGKALCLFSRASRFSTKNTAAKELPLRRTIPLASNRENRLKTIFPRQRPTEAMISTHLSIPSSPLSRHR